MEERDKQIKNLTRTLTTPVAFFNPNSRVLNLFTFANTYDPFKLSYLEKNIMFKCLKKKISKELENIMFFNVWKKISKKLEKRLCKTSVRNPCRRLGIPVEM